jgi:DNA polymerase-1
LYVDYKRSASRVKSKSTKPDWFDDLKSWTVEAYDGCIITDNCEADDMVRIWAVEAKAADIQHCVVTIDKDLDCIPGSHYNPRTKVIYQIEEEWANYFYWKQLLMGDSVDNIPGIMGIGPKKAEKILEGSKNKDEHVDRICREYHNAYGDNGFDHMLLNGKLLHIWRHINDHFVIKKEVYEAAIKG